MMKTRLCLLVLCLALPRFLPASEVPGQLRVGVFDVDASPPVGSPLAYDPATGIQTPLSCRGLVLLGSGKPIVLCAIDWIGLSNGGHLAFRQGLARGAATDRRTS